MNLFSLNRKIIDCKLCPRLVKYRQEVKARASFKDEAYWRRPVPGFGDANAWLLILGLAPAAQGANRTGRMFTGDPSATFLMQALHLTELANQPTSESKKDRLTLLGCYMTTAVKCVPPKNLPNAQERQNCSQYLAAELNLLTSLQAVLALGKWAFDSYLSLAKKIGEIQKYPSFAHGAQCTFPKMPPLYGSYHPSPQNTYTKKLTLEMLTRLLTQIKKECECNGF